MASLTTRFANINVDDWKKLRICISYLNQTMDDVRIIGVFNTTNLFILVDVSYAVYPNTNSQTVGVMSIGYGILHCLSSKTNMNTKTSTEAELIETSEYVTFNT